MVAALKWKNNRPPVLPDVRTQQLIQAAEDGDCETINELVSTGLGIDCETVNGTTALMKAVSFGRSNAVRLMVDLGAAVNKSRPDGFTPLILAVFFGHQDITSELLVRGADLSQKAKGVTAVMWATARGFMSIALMLEAAEKSPTSLKGPSYVEQPAVVPPAQPAAKLTHDDDRRVDSKSTKSRIRFEPNQPLSASTEWSVQDALTGEGIRRVGPPGKQVRIQEVWDRPLANLEPFSPVSALMARLSTKRNLATAAIIAVLVAGASVAGVTWRSRHTPGSVTKIQEIASPSNLTGQEVKAPSNSTPANEPVVPESAHAVETSISSNSKPVDQKAEALQPAQTSNEIKREADVARDASEPRILKPIVKSLKSNRTNHRRRAIAGDTSKNDSDESNRPAAVTIVDKPPTGSSQRSRTTNDLPAQPVAPIAGSTNKKRVIQWP